MRVWNTYGIKLEALKSCMSSRKLPRKTASPGKSSSFPRVIKSASMMKEVDVIADIVEEHTPHCCQPYQNAGDQPL
jgi:hypothetical protein